MSAIGGRSDQGHKPGAGDTHQPGGGCQRPPLQRLNRTDDVAGDGEQHRGIDAVQGAHDKRDEARSFIQERGDQPVKQQVCRGVEKTLLLRGTNIVKVSVVQICPRRIEVIIAQIPVVIRPEGDRQHAHAATDKRNQGAKVPRLE